MEISILRPMVSEWTEKTVMLKEVMAPGLSLLAVSPCLEIPSPTLLTKRDGKR